MTRQAALSAFIKDCGLENARIVSLAGDASNRKYLRLFPDNSTSVVLMDAPPEKGEDVRPFVKIANHLTSIGLSAPRILGADEKQGFLLIEDLGDALFAREIRRDLSLETPLYEAATDVLTALHRCASPPLDTYDASTTVPLAALTFDWYFAGAAGTTNAAARQEFVDAFTPVIRQFDADLTVLIQRDYHAENLLWLPHREAVARVGLLDFQDAMLGHPVYDLVSVLQDARRDVSPQIETAMKLRFVQQNGLDRDEFETAYAVFGAQRNLRILGVFARLCMRDAKAHYVDMIPRVWGHVQSNLAHPALSDVAEILNATLPEPDAAVLSTLKSKCGTCTGP